jgi:hypothetical protein
MAPLVGECERPPPPDGNLQPGDECETVNLVILRKEEDVHSEVVTVFPEGQRMQVLLVGKTSKNRAKISCDTVQGWVTMCTSSGEPLLTKAPQKAVQPVAVEGEPLEATAYLVVREEEPVGSRLVSEIEPGTLVRVLEMGKNVNRARIATKECKGWISLKNARGESLLGHIPLDRRGLAAPPEKERALATPTTSKTLLEHSRAGDLPSLQRLLENHRDVDVNTADVAGRTPLMYAAAFGHITVLEYLLQSCNANINELDHTKKSALHHASARRTRGDGGADALQAKVVTILIHANAQIDARDYHGSTPLMYSLLNGSLASKLLVDAGAALDLRDFNGNACLDYARALK